MIKELEGMLSAITHYEKISL